MSGVGKLLRTSTGTSMVAAMAKAKKAFRSSKKSPAINKALIAEVTKLVEPLNLEVLGHVESEALCCRNGTVALVKIDRGDPAPMTAQARRSRASR
jgi:hypothetical protein